MDINIVIVNPHHDKKMEEALFRKTDDDLFYYFVEEPGFDMFDILVRIGMFPSKNQARKNWKRTDKEIPAGWSEFKNCGKLNHTIYIWNPIEFAKV